MEFSVEAAKPTFSKSSVCRRKLFQHYCSSNYRSVAMCCLDRYLNRHSAFADIVDYREITAVVNPRALNQSNIVDILQVCIPSLSPFPPCPPSPPLPRPSPSLPSPPRCLWVSCVHPDKVHRKNLDCCYSNICPLLTMLVTCECEMPQGTYLPSQRSPHIGMLCQLPCCATCFGLFLCCTQCTRAAHNYLRAILDYIFGQSQQTLVSHL